MSSQNYTYHGCYKDKSSRAIPTQVQNVSSVDQCGKIAKNKNSSVFGVQYGGQCFIGNNLSQAKKYGFGGNNCGALGGTWTNQVYTLPTNNQCNYQMNNVELSCYKDRYPDLNTMSPTQLQTHWSTTGCKENRNNQCPSPQISSGKYQFKGCYNDTKSTPRAIPNYQGNNMNANSCEEIAKTKRENVFGLQYNGQCWTGNNVQNAYKYGANYNGGSCGNLGGSYTNLVYTIDKPYPPPDPPVPQLSSINFAKETFINKYNYPFVYFISLFVIVILILNIYWIVKCKRS